MEVEGSKVSERPKEASHPPQSKSPASADSQPIEPKNTSEFTTIRSTTPSKVNTSVAATAEQTMTSMITTTTTAVTSNGICDVKLNGTMIKDKSRFRDEKYNPLSVRNLLRKDPVTRRAPVPITMPQPPERHSTTTTTATTTSCSPTTHTIHSKWAQQPKVSSPLDYTAAFLNPLVTMVKKEFGVKLESNAGCDSASETEDENYSSAAGLIDTNLNLLATIQHLHCQVMLALTERLRPAVASSPSATAAMAPNHESS